MNDATTPCHFHLKQTSSVDMTRIGHATGSPQRSLNFKVEPLQCTDSTCTYAFALKQILSPAYA